MSFAVNFPKYPQELDIVRFDTVAALRAYSVTGISTNAHAVTDGQAGSGDGHGALYVWSATATGADDGNATIKPTGVTGAGRWLAVAVAATGAPGANVMAVGLFTGCAGMAIPSGTTAVTTTGFRTVGKGAGRYVYDATVDATYVAAHPGWTFQSADLRGWKLDEEQKLRFEMFGAYGDGTTDDYPQWLIAKDFIQTHAVVHGNSYYKSVPALHFGRFIYRFSSHLDLTDGVYTLKGAGPSAFDRGGNTFFQPDAGHCGIILQSWDTTGVSGTVTNTAKGSACSHISDITIYGQGGTVGSLAEIGFLIKAPAFLERCNVYNMGGHGFYVAADVTHAGNANCGKMRDCVAMYNGLSGFRFEGGDANAWELHGLNAIFNGTWGIHDLSFLGNHFYGFHTAGNGTNSAGPNWASAGTRKTAQVSYNGHLYRVYPGQETWCSTHAPTGAVSSNQGWLYYAEGGPNGTFPAWVSGIACTQGGAFYVTGASTKTGVFGGYMESDQSNGYCDAGRAVIIAGGFSGWTFPAGIANFIGAMDGRMVIPYLGTGGGNGEGIELRPDQIQIGPQVYFQRTSAETFDLRGTLGISASMSRWGSGAAQPYAMAFPAGINATVPTFADNAAAATGGLPVGGFYKTSTGQLMVRY